MTLPIAVGIYTICWWLVFFIMLPIGVRTQAEEGVVEPGTEESAPIAPHLALKAIAATLISAVLFAIVYAVIVYQIIRFDWLPASL